MADHPPTNEIVRALRTLGVEGPAQAVDVLNAAALVLPPEQVAAVMNGVVIARVAAQVPPEPGNQLVGPAHPMHDEGDEDPPGVSWSGVTRETEPGS